MTEHAALLNTVKRATTYMELLDTCTAFLAGRLIERSGAVDPDRSKVWHAARAAILDSWGKSQPAVLAAYQAERDACTS